MTDASKPELAECENCGCVYDETDTGGLCPECAENQPCHHCGGTGHVPNHDPLFFGMDRDELICPVCKGEGYP